MNWIEILEQDQTNGLITRLRNVTADLEAGYNPAGELIRKQIDDIMITRIEIAKEREIIAAARKDSERAAQRMARYELKRRGAI